MDKDFKDLIEKRQNEKSLVDNSVDKITDIIKGTDLSLGKMAYIISKVMANFDHTQDRYCKGNADQLIFDWTIGSYIQDKFRNHVNQLIEISNYLIENDYTSKDNRYDLEHGDRYIYLHPIKFNKRRVMVFENQNISFVMILESYTEDNKWEVIKHNPLFSELNGCELHIREIKPNLEEILKDPDASDDLYHLVDDLDGKIDADDIIRAGVNNIKYLTQVSHELWGDETPSLEDFIKHNFCSGGQQFMPLCYGDARDHGYIFSNRDDKKFYSHYLSKIKIASSEIIGAYNHIFNEEY